jgi:hypothetical protein
MRACRWDGLTAVPTPFAFGKAVAEPALPRAGKPCVVKVGVTGSDSPAEDVNAAIDSGALAVLVTLGGVDGTPLGFESEFGADGKIHVSFAVPETAEGKRLTVKLTIGPDIPSGTKIVAFTVGR